MLHDASKGKTIILICVLYIGLYRLTRSEVSSNWSIIILLSFELLVKRYTLELYNDYSYLALYKFFDFHSCLNVDI